MKKKYFKKDKTNNRHRMSDFIHHISPVKILTTSSVTAVLLIAPKAFLAQYSVW